MPRELTERDISRFWSKVALPNEQGCMLWLSAVPRSGYGCLFAGGRTQYAHRISYIIAIGLIPMSLQIDHLCRVRHCVAPAHLEAVTQRVNLLRGQGASAINAARTHCKHGHAFDEANTYVTPKGVRQCRTCKRLRQRVYDGRVMAA